MIHERPDYVRCIRQTQADKTKLTWCDRRAMGEWAFENIDHAAYNGIDKGRLVPCPNCLIAILKALNP